MDEAERRQLYWELKAQSTAFRGQQLLEEQAPPVRFGPNRDQTAQARPGRRARVLSADERRARLAQQGQPAAPPPQARPASPPPAASQPQTSSPPPPPPAEASPAASHPTALPAAPQTSAPPTMEWSPAQPATPHVQPAAPPPASSQTPSSAAMEWSACPSPQPTQTMSNPTTQPFKPPLFPPRPQVFCIPASPPPIIPSRLFKFSFPFFPPPFPARTSQYSLPSQPPIPPRPFILSVRYPGIPPRPYFLSGECVSLGPAIPQRLFFLSGECVSHFFVSFSLLMCFLCRFMLKVGLPKGIFLHIFERCFLSLLKNFKKKQKDSWAVFFSSCFCQSTFALLWMAVFAVFTCWLSTAHQLFCTWSVSFLDLLFCSAGGWRLGCATYSLFFTWDGC